MELSVTNDPQTEYYIVVEEDDKIRNEWQEVFSKMPHAVPVVTDSINEALCAWSRLFINGCVPRCVVVSWNMAFMKTGPQYFLQYCLDISQEGTFVVYTNSSTDAVEKLKDDPIVGPHVTIVRKDKYSAQQTLDLINKSPSFQQENSGFFTIGTF